MPYPETTTGFAIKDTKNWSSFTKQELPLKKFEDHDIDIAVSACGVCGSDVHTITGGWGEIPLPLCVGHEIVGTAIRVGPKVKNIKVGDRVGVGAQIHACLECDICKADQENYCPHQVDTYGAEYPDGTVSQGGYSSHVRAHEYFTFKIPEGLSDEVAAPMLCAGITTYSPLVRLGCGPGKKVAVVGLGGLGHFAVMFAAALGAEVTCISHSPDKKEDALKLGASHFVSSKDKNWDEGLKYKFDFILNAADVLLDFDLTQYFGILKINGTFHNVGMPDHSIELKLQDFASTGCYIGTSHIGNRPEMEAMLKLAADKKLHTWYETIDVSADGCKEAVERVKNNDRVRYRFTLTGFDKEFGKRT
ncbi:GroES-like protein [Microthyrium microscopicum]|uniref:alcohol dehydrogenase (NADP(+)) n=1 Tax=Microthyrium microscopicum TaxID=703497 RepID=A0A6A6U8R8_9PEZI|nr:GroES-like protein [Microthyrium microscopicum]